MTVSPSSQGTLTNPDVFLNEPFNFEDALKADSVKKPDCDGKTNGKDGEMTDCNGHIPYAVCANCGTTSTPCWRQSADDENVCNVYQTNTCGLYEHLHHEARPKSKIRAVT
jgi:GATA zinc finger